MKRFPWEGSSDSAKERVYGKIGMMVRGVHDGGFVTVVNIGGLDRQILPASDVQLWGDKKTIPGVVAATPPHL